MGKLLINIKSAYQKMSKTEKKIADYILHNQNNVPMTITELAKATGTSEATIVRFAKKIGCNGYQQLKIMLAKEEHHIVNRSIDEKDDFIQIFSKISDDVYSTLIKTREINTDEEFEYAYNLISKAKEIIVIGVGNSYAISLDLYHKLLRLGFNVASVPDSHFQLIEMSKAKPSTLVIAISHSGCTKEIIDSVTLAKESNAKAMTITSDRKSPLAKKCDLSLCTVSEEINYRMLGLSSRYGQLAIIDTLYTYIAMKNPDSQKTIEKIEDNVLLNRVQPKKKNN
ncbi:MAG: MurR/RpiR family transcriptional regulator [Bacilli bacterium]|nr:MurR/RpiR family transcriptional regulator [Bacilli bacterium]